MFDLGFVEPMLKDVSFWGALGKITVADILLGGDNAILIALACRNLPTDQRNKGIIWGTLGAILLRVILIVFALQLLTLPYLKIVGGILLLWVGIKLMADSSGHGDVSAKDNLWAAVRTIIIADLVMSVDNVLGIAGATHSAPAEYQLTLVVLGLFISIPIVVWGSKFVMVVMEKYPLVITLGAALMGFLAGEMLWTDPIIVGQLGEESKKFVMLAGLVGAAVVLGAGFAFKAVNKNK